MSAGFIVIADRYIYTLMARDWVQGMNRQWVTNLYGMALIPDAVFYLNVSPTQLIQRNLSKNKTLDYWESGMDVGLSRDIFDSFVEYQKRMKKGLHEHAENLPFPGHRWRAELRCRLR